MSGGAKVPICGIGPVGIRLDLVVKSYGNLEFDRTFALEVEEEDEEIEEEEEDEQQQEEEEEEEEQQQQE